MKKKKKSKDKKKKKKSKKKSKKSKKRKDKKSKSKKPKTGYKFIKLLEFFRFIIMFYSEVKLPLRRARGGYRRGYGAISEMTPHLGKNNISPHGKILVFTPGGSSH